MTTKTLVVRITAVSKNDAYYERDRKNLLNKHVIIKLGGRSVIENCWPSAFEKGYYTGNASLKKPVKLDNGGVTQSLFFYALKFAVIKEITK